MSQQQTFQAVGGHVAVFVDELKQAIASAMATAAEGIRLESEVARVQQRMEAFHSVLQGIDAQKQAVTEALEAAESEAQKQSLRLQLSLLDRQTVAVLTRSGVPEGLAEKSVAQLENGSSRRAASNGHHSRRQRRNHKGQFADRRLQATS